MNNAADLLDRLLKDIVTEYAQSLAYQSSGHTKQEASKQPPGSVASDSSVQLASAVENRLSFDETSHPLSPSTSTFSIPRFIPLLAERIYTLNPHTRTFLISWLSVLDSETHFSHFVFILKL